MASSAYELLEAYVQLTHRGFSEVLAAIETIEAAIKRVSTTPTTVSFQSNAQSVLVAAEAVEATWERTNAAIAQVNTQLAVTQQRILAITSASARQGVTQATAVGAANNPALGAVQAATASAAQSQAAFAGAASSAAGFITQLAGMAAAAAAAGAALSVLREGVTEAFSQEKSRIAFQALTGSAEDTLRIMNELADFAKESPFSFPELRETAQRMLAVGVSSDELIETLKNLAQVAAASGTNLAQLTKAYTDVMAKGNLTAQELNQFANANVPILAALETTLKRPREQIKKLAEDGLVSAEAVREAFQLMTREGGRFAGIMEEVNTLSPEVLSNIADDAKQIASHLTRWSLGLFKDELELVRDTLDVIERGLRSVTQFGAKDLTSKGAANTEALIEQQSAITRAILKAARLTTLVHVDAASDAINGYLESVNRAANATVSAASKEVKAFGESRAASQLRRKEAEESAIEAEKAAEKIVKAWEKEFKEADRKFTQFWKSIQRRLKQEADQQLSDTIKNLQDDTRAAEALRRSLMTPMDEFKERIAEAQELLSKGLINGDEFGQVFKQASKDLDEIDRKVRGIGRKQTLSIVGTQESVRFELAASKEQQNQLNELKLQARQDAERNRILNGVKEGIDKLNERIKTPEVTADTFPSEIF